jgi:hypothetical protein
MVTGKPPARNSDERRLPPIAEMAVVTMALVIVGGIDIAAYLPRRAPLGPPIGLLVAAGFLLVANLVALSRLRKFAWDKFFLVGGCALLAYIVIAGMLEYVFVLDHTPRTLLVLMSMMLAIFAVDIPLLFAFSVARYQPAPGK